MKLIYGTKNKSKLNHMEKIFKPLPYEVTGIDHVLEDALESGEQIIENAREKALHYYRLLKQPVFSCDSGLYFDHLEDKKQPGVHIRRIAGKRLNDQEMIAYYGNLAKENGGEAICRYRNAICLVLDEEHIYTYDGDDLASEPFKIVEKPHQKVRNGFPLDSLSVEIESGEYYYDLGEYHVEESSMNDGFRAFFKRCIKNPTVQMKFKGYEVLEFELFPEYAPESVKNFLEHIRTGYYNDKALCRIVPGRLIQSGDPKLKPETWTDDTPGYILDGEFNRTGYLNPLTFKKGTLGMAMAADKITPYATAGSFFIMNHDEPKLDDIVPAFGRITKGLEIIDQINQVKTHTRYGYDAPEEVIPLEWIKAETYGFVFESPKKIYKTF